MWFRFSCTHPLPPTIPLSLCRSGQRRALAMGQVQVVDVEELGHWFPQQMGPSEGYIHARYLQRHDPADAILCRT